MIERISICHFNIFLLHGHIAAAIFNWFVRQYIVNGIHLQKLEDNKKQVQQVHDK